VNRVINFQVPRDKYNSLSSLHVQPNFTSLCDTSEHCRMLWDQFKNISQMIKADRS
jgi:hypothetical protein